jgi:hypothetical protein
LARQSGGTAICAGGGVRCDVEKIQAGLEFAPRGTAGDALQTAENPAIVFLWIIRPATVAWAAGGRVFALTAASETGRQRRPVLPRSVAGRQNR